MTPFCPNLAISKFPGGAKGSVVNAAIEMRSDSAVAA